jgi:SAM-dependent methyltransferase
MSGGIWPFKILAKLLLARLHTPYRFWSKLGVFRHGHMETAKYAVSVFADHVNNAFPRGLPRGAAVLELGPGDSLASALVAAAHGSSKVYLVDVAAFAQTDPGFYRSLADSLARTGLKVPDIRNAKTLAEILALCNAEYLTDGLKSLRRIPDQSVDLIWSQAVLEHVRKAEFETTIAELFRILKPHGKASHAIDFKDHLTEGLNNLRFSERLWESELFATSGFYTNRIHAPAMLKMFENCGFENIEVRKEWHWGKLPIRRSVLDRSFKTVPEEDLLISGIKVMMNRPTFAEARLLAKCIHE